MDVARSNSEYYHVIITGWYLLYHHCDTQGIHVSLLTHVPVLVQAKEEQQERSVLVAAGFR